MHRITPQNSVSLEHVLAYKCIVASETLGGLGSQVDKTCKLGRFHGTLRLYVMCQSQCHMQPWQLSGSLVQGLMPWAMTGTRLMPCRNSSMAYLQADVE